MTTPEVRLERLRPDGIEAALEPGADRLDPARRPRVPRRPPAQRHRRADRSWPAGGGGRADRRGRPAVVVPDDGHPGPSVVVPVRPGAGRGGVAPDPSPVARVRRPARGRPHGPRPARPEPPDQAGVRRGLGRWLGAAGDGALLPGAECRPRHRARDGLAGRGRPWLDDGDLVGRGARTGPGGGGSVAGRSGGDACRRLRAEPALHRRRGTWARHQIDAAAGAPGRTRARRVLRGEPFDPFADLRDVRRALLAGTARAGGSGRVARRCRVDGGPPAHQPWTRVALPVRAVAAARRRVDPECRRSSWSTRRSGRPAWASAPSELGPERGFYIRRQQTAEVRLPGQCRPDRTRSASSSRWPGSPRRCSPRRSSSGERGRAGGMVRTVRGPVDPAALGITTMHEHLWMDSTPLLAVHGYETTAAGPWDAATAAEARWNPGVHTDNYRLTDVDAAVEELAPVRPSGWRHDRRADPAVAWPGRPAGRSRSPSAPDCTW